MRIHADQKGKVETIHEGNFLNFVRKGEWEYIERNNCTAVVIIVSKSDDGRVIFVEQYRPPVDQNIIEYPAGLVNDSDHPDEETALDAAKRELLEETGYASDQWTQILEGPISGGTSAEIVTMFLATEAKKVGMGGGDGTESIIVHEIPLKECDGWLKEMESKGYLIEPKIYTGLYFLKSYNSGS